MAGTQYLRPHFLKSIQTLKFSMEFCVFFFSVNSTKNEKSIY
jgi:hypothetical protein